MNETVRQLADELRLPFEGEVLKSTVQNEGKRKNETVVFVHHFGGSKRTLLRHAKLMNELGYDAVVFNLLYHDAKSPIQTLPITGDLKFGARYVWSEQIEAILNAVPGKKIIFSFSMPSNAVVDAIARRRGEDITAWICDGGPFLQLFKCAWNLYTHQFEIPSRVFRAAFTSLSVILFGPKIELTLEKSFAQFPPNFPVLSIHGNDDKLVPIQAIDQFFSYAKDLDLERVDIEDAGHLESYRMNAMEYRTRVRTFLAKVK